MRTRLTRQINSDHKNGRACFASGYLRRQVRQGLKKKGTDFFFCSCRLGLEIRRALSLGLGRDMPRRGTGVLQPFSSHVVQRGHNKQVVSAEKVDFLYYLSTLEEYKEI